MNKFTFTFFFFLLFFQFSWGLDGEFWFLIRDNENNNYYVIARRISTSDPLFGINHMEVETNLYDYVISATDQIQGNPPAPYNIRRGFDMLFDTGHFIWPLIGNGKLEFLIYRVNSDRSHQLAFKFKLNLLHSYGTDFTFKYDSYTGIMLISGQGFEETEVPYNADLKQWEIRNQTQDLSWFVNDVELTNFLATGPEHNIKTIFTTAVMGFPYPENFQTGEEYDPGTIVPLWRGVYYGVTVSHTTYTKNNIIYNFRNWFETENFSSSTTFQILNNTSRFRSDFQPTHPLTVSGYFEGGSGINYQLTWQNPPLTQPWQFGNVFNAFNYPINEDVYTVTASTPIQALGTTWYFRHWNDGSTNNTKANLQITSPTSYTAYYKGLQRSDDQNAYVNNGQRKAVKLHNGTLLSLYRSYNKVWLEKSFDSGQSWSFWAGGPIPFYDSPEYFTPAIDAIPWEGAHSHAAIVYGQDNNIKLNIIRTGQTASILPETVGTNPGPNASLPFTPVVAASGDRILIVCNGGMNEYNQEGLMYFYGSISLNGSIVSLNWLDKHEWPDFKIITGSTYASKNPSIVADKNDSTVFHITWQEVNSIKYCKATGSGNNLTFSAVETVSASSPFSSNLYPSISLANGNPVISWTGSGKLVSEKISGKENFERPTSKAVIRRKGTTWGDFQLAGNNVNFTNNNSVSSAQGKTVIVWSEGTTNPQSKWLKRTGSNYFGPCNLSHSGIEAQVISGSDYQYMTSMVFNNNQLPYYFTKSTTNFYPECSQGGGLEKITNLSDSIVTYGRAGITNINDVAFIFNVGDVIVSDSIVRFIEKPDTLIYSTYEDLNQYTRTDDFQLNSSSQFYFSNLYYVMNIEQADSSLTENDNVNFKVELVNSITSQVVGVFDNITYDKNNLGKYDNISYQVNCSGIQPGNYYLRLVTTVNGEANYTLANIINETANLDKRHYQTINYDGTEKPVSYSLEQNYPNPFNPSTTIRYQLPQDGMVTLKVYDILGSEVATLVNEQKAAGRYEINFDASRLASGVYIYKIASGNYIQSRKMMMVK